MLEPYRIAVRYAPDHNEMPLDALPTHKRCTIMASWKIMANHSVPIEGPPFRLSDGYRESGVSSGYIDFFPQRFARCKRLYSLRSDSATHIAINAMNHPMKARMKVTRNTG